MFNLQRSNSMTRNKIIMAARDLFEEKGFDSTTVREIAAKANVNVALINYHFGSKDALLESLIEEMANATHFKLHDINKSSAKPEEKLHQAVELLIDKIFANKKYYQMIHRELSMNQRPDIHDKISKVLKRNRNEIKTIIEEGQQKKVFRKDIDIELTIGTMFGLIHQVTHAGLKLGLQDEDSKLKPRLYQHLLEVLSCFLIKKQ
jgi:TetR/AcrR family fatty acid metabolism transcriptional regulator